MDNRILYSWGKKLSKNVKKKIEINDETLRDGLQATYVKHPSIKEKIEFLLASDKLGIDSINIGFPVTSDKSKKEIIRITNFAKEEGLKIKIECGGRILKEDVEAIIDVSQKTGVQIIAGLFIASSKIRYIVENWDLKEMGKLIEQNISLAVKNNLDVMFVSEDTSRAYPKTVSYLYNAAIDAGAKRLCICDTVGESNPYSAYNLVSFVKNNIIKKNKKIKIDWHGHNDRGLATANSLAAIAAGADCIQVAALGVGERAGNTVMEEILINLHKEGLIKANLEHLENYSKIASKILKMKIRPNAPVIGSDIFKTATGVHASAIKKALQLKNKFLAENVYTSISPSSLGRKHEILIGPVSGKSNVEWYLKKKRIKPTAALTDLILNKARIERRILTEKDIDLIIKPRKKKY